MGMGLGECGQEERICRYSVHIPLHWQSGGGVGVDYRLLGRARGVARGAAGPRRGARRVARAAGAVRDAQSFCKITDTLYYNLHQDSLALP